MKPKTKKLIRILFIGTGFLLAGMLINFIPTWNLESPNMNVLRGKTVRGFESPLLRHVGASLVLVPASFLNRSHK